MWLRRMASACNLKAKPLGSVRSDLTAWTVKRNKVWNLHYISKTVNLKSDDSSCDVMWCNLFSHTQVYLSHPLIVRCSSFLLPNTCLLLIDYPKTKTFLQTSTQGRFPFFLPKKHICTIPKAFGDLKKYWSSCLPTSDIVAWNVTRTTKIVYCNYVSLLFGS